MKKLSRAAQNIWAKKAVQDGSLLWLPLAVHLADAAFVAQKLWNSWLSDGVKRAIAAGLKEKNLAEAEQLFIFLAAGHDLGKAIPVFQAKQTRPLCLELDAQIERKLMLAGLPMESYRTFARARKTPHALATQILLENAGCSRNVASILGAHHGKPPTSDILVSSGPGSYGFNYHLEKTGKIAWTAVQQELLNFALDLAGFSRIEEIPEPNMATQVLLCGLLIMADWIASNEEIFPYLRPEEALAGLNSEVRTATAWERLALPYPWEAGNAWMNADLYRERFTFVPNLLQTIVAETAASISNPGIFVLEAPMGTGKTEAALACAEIFADKAQRGGVFFTLPTQATSNGIFPRLRDWANRLDTYGGHAIKLAHGKAQFNEDYQALKFLEGSTQIGDDEQTSVFVHEWFEGQKKSLLADFVVGTIDQLLLAALKQKHVMLRHLGIADKVVIIDECHAYDAYMGQYLYRALNWLGAYRVPVIVLSATLPAQRREEVINAYLNKDSIQKQSDPLGKSLHTSVQPAKQLPAQPAKQLPAPDRPSSNFAPNFAPNFSPASAPGDDYPLMTYTDHGKVQQKAVPPDGGTRTVRLHFISEEELKDRLEEMLAGGGCAGVVVNTVRRAQELAQVLRDHFGEEVVRLLHSRFLAPDRATKERELLLELGKPGPGRQRPAKRIVVGTQVLEQSLDIDFDVLVTDLCPMDLLLQRIGRLHRHARNRPAKLSTAHCLVTGCSDDGFEAGAESIYGTYLLMRTKALLPEQLALPQDIPFLVQGTYDDPRDLSPEPPGYRQAKIKQEELIADKEKRAGDFRIDPVWPDFVQNLVGWLDTDLSERQGEAAVRDTDESIEILLVQRKGDGRIYFLPWLENGREIPLNEIPVGKMAIILAQQRISLPRLFCTPWMIEKTIVELEHINSKNFPQWQESPWLKGELFLALDGEYSASLCGYRLSYSKNDGLLYEKENGEVEEDA